MKSFAITSVVTLFVLAGLSAFAAGPNGKMSATATVTMKAIVPEYLALNPVNVEPVMFDFRGSDDNAKHISGGWHNGVASLSKPSWGLAYNLRINRTITVCAYASDFQGTTSGTTAVIPVNYLSGTSLQGVGGNTTFGVMAADCTNQTGSKSGAILLDKITGADATSTGNRFGVDRIEGFSSMSLRPSAAGDYVPTPDTYRGRLTIVVQAI